MTETVDSRSQLLLDSTPDLVWEVDRECRLRTSNRAYDEAMRLVFGRPLEPGTEVLALPISPELRAYWSGAYRRVLGEGESFVETVRRLVAPAVWMEYQFGPVVDRDGKVDGAVVVGRDVTRRCESERALERSRGELRAIYDSAPVMMAVIDRSRRVLLANPCLTSYTGISEEDLLAGRACGVLGCINALDHPDGCGYGNRCADCSLRRAIQDTFETGRTHREVERRMTVEKDGRPAQIVLVASTALVPSEDEPKLVLCLQDATARSLAEEEVRRLNEELEERVLERTAELESTVRQIEAFSYSVSHDLRAPVRAIDGYAAMLERDHAASLDDEARRLLAVVRKSTHRMGALVDDLLRLSRLGRADMKVGPVDMEHLFLEAVAEVSPHEARSEVRVESLPEAMGDPALLRVVAVNLVSNALKFSARKERPEIVVGYGPGPGGDSYFVRDNGAGFDPRYQDKLFGVFQRLHAESEFGGTGIGLALVKQIVERHGGKVFAEGRPGEGATFRFSLGKPASVSSGSHRRLGAVPSPE